MTKTEELREGIFHKDKYTEEGWKELLQICQFVIALEAGIGSIALKQLGDYLDTRHSEILEIIWRLAK